MNSCSFCSRCKYENVLSVLSVAMCPIIVVVRVVGIHCYHYSCNIGLVFIVVVDVLDSIVLHFIHSQPFLRVC